VGWSSISIPALAPLDKLLSPPQDTELGALGVDLDGVDGLDPPRMQKAVEGHGRDLIADSASIAEAGSREGSNHALAGEAVLAGSRPF